MPVDSNITVFYINGVTKIMQQASKFKDLKEKCTEALNNLKTLEKAKANLGADLSQNINKYFKPLEMACATKKAAIVEPALDCLEKLMAYKFIDSQTKYAGDPSKLLIDVVIATICNTFDSQQQEDNVQLQILKALLTGVTTCDIKGGSVKQTVKTCFNIHLVSKNPVNQNTVQFTLPQILNVIFQRMETTQEKSDAPLETGKDDEDEDMDDTDPISPVKESATKKPQPTAQQQLGTPTNSGTPKTPVPQEETPEQFISGMVKSAIDKVVGEGKPEAAVATTTTTTTTTTTIPSPATPTAPKKHVFFNQYQKDAFLIFKALCRLSMKKIPPNAAADSMEMRSRILSLQLIHNVLERSGPIFRSSESFIINIKQYLCLTLLKNSVSQIPSIFRLSLLIFKSLTIHFKEHLKTEIGMFFTNAFLRILESTNSSFNHKNLVIEILNEICKNPQTLVDLFVNYDCALESLNIYESLLHDLAKAIQAQQVEANWVTPPQEAQLKHSALKTISSILKSMVEWMQKKEKKKTESESAQKIDTEMELFEKQRHMKIDLKEGISLFNKSPKKGIEYLVKAGQLKGEPQDIATFLYTVEGLDKKSIGEYIGAEVHLPVLSAFARLQNFKASDFEAALRSFLNTFRLPGEGQQIDRIVQKFAEKFYQDNPESVFANADAAYVFAYSVIMLNTELHNPGFANRKRMELDGFIRQNGGINDGGNLPDEYLAKIFNNIKGNEIKLLAEHQPRAKEEAETNDPSTNFLNTAKKKQILFDREGDKIVQVTKNMFAESWKQGLGNNAFYIANDLELVKPMFEVSGEPVLNALTIMFDSLDENSVNVGLCLETMEAAIHVAAQFGLAEHREKLVALLAKWTNLNNLTTMRQRNIDAIKLMIKIAAAEGNYLKDSWSHVLNAISQLEKIFSISTGTGSELLMVDTPPSRPDSPAGGMKKTPSQAKITAQPTKPTHVRKPSDTNLSAKAKTPQQSQDYVTSQTIMNQIDNKVVDRIFEKSGDLDDDAIVDFVKALCAVSQDELQSNNEPRKFSLQKLIEVAHYNMKRIKIVWSKIWVHMADHFITVGCHANQTISMNAIDSLRQLAMQFLEQAELANYHFQRDFLKPFMQIMQQSKNPVIRELVVQCVGVMMLKRSANIKSGWRTILQILGVAAMDKQEVVIKGAFSYVAQIMTDYFHLLSDSFVDCVHCLVAFSKNPLNSDISVKSIEFLDTCAANIVNGKVEGLKIEKDLNGIAFNDEKTHYKVWFPVMTGLSQLTSDVRMDVRMKALNTLFHVLKLYGNMFSSELWKTIFTGVLFPIFADIKQVLDESNGLKVTDTEWMKTTCQKAMLVLVELYAEFYSICSFILPDVLKTITLGIRQESELLASVGIESFKALMIHAGPKFTDENWNEICKIAQILVEKMNIIELVPSETTATKITLNPGFLAVKGNTNLLLIQALNDAVLSQYANMKTEHIQQILSTLDNAYNCARVINESHFINDTKPESIALHSKLTVIPTILKIEVSAIAAHLTIVFKLFAETSEKWQDRVDLAEKIITSRCIDLLQRYMVKASLLPATAEYSPLNAKEMEALITIVVLIMTGLLGFTNDQFKKHVGKFYPHICNLILSHHKEIRTILKDVLARVGTLYIQ